MPTNASSDVTIVYCRFGWNRPCNNRKLVWQPYLYGIALLSVASAEFIKKIRGISKKCYQTRSLRWQPANRSCHHLLFSPPREAIQIIVIGIIIGISTWRRLLFPKPLRIDLAASLASSAGGQILITRWTHFNDPEMPLVYNAVNECQLEIIDFYKIS